MNQPYQMTDPQIAEMITSFEEHYDTEWTDPASSSNTRNWEAAWSKACEFMEKWGHHKPILLGMGDIPVDPDAQLEVSVVETPVVTAETQIQQVISEYSEPLAIDDLKKSYTPEVFIGENTQKTLEIKI